MLIFGKEMEIWEFVVGNFGIKCFDLISKYSCGFELEFLGVETF